MNVRQANREDVDILADLNSEVQRLHANALPHLFKQPENRASIEADFAERILPNPAGRVFIVEVEGEPAGYVYAQVIHRPDNPYTFAFDTIHIDQIGVVPIYQGRGCGRALIQAVFDMARVENISRVVLDTHAFNTEAQAFFKRMGFDVFIYRMDAHLDFERGT
jgi:ribosomal protein S18 acetylase RimI-like enzyme